MVCYSDGYKSLCAKVVVGISVLGGLLGLVCVIFGAMSMGVIETPEDKGFSTFVPPDMNGTGTGVLVLGLIVIGTAILGCATSKFKHPCIATLFIIMTLVMGLVLLIVGFIAAAGGEIYMAASVAGCAMDDSYPLYKAAVDANMCTDICPCNSQNQEVWTLAAVNDEMTAQFQLADRTIDDFVWASEADTDNFYNSW